MKNVSKEVKQISKIEFYCTVYSQIKQCKWFIKDCKACLTCAYKTF